MTVIANETAGSGTAAEVLKGVMALLQNRGISFRVETTKGPGHAGTLASCAVEKGETEIVCVGGDGTFFETINGLAGRFVTMYLVPCGTGNDFVKMLPLPKDPLEALKAQLDGVPGRIDVGRLNDYCFLNVSGGGFDTEVLKQAARFKRLGKGLLPYLMGIFAALKDFRPMPVEITADGKTWKQDVTIFSVGNGSYIGGGMKAVPHARIDDGLFDVVVADGLNKPLILKLLSKFISGKHTEFPQVKEWRCQELTVRCPGMTVNIDGELFVMDEARYQILPGALGVRLPAGAAGAA